MQLHGLEQMVAADGLLRRLTRLSGFRGLLDDYRHAFSSDLGLVVTTDGDALSRTFFDWMEAVDRDARFCAVDRHDFLVFSAGLLLREFLRHEPCAIEGGSGEPRSPSLDAIVAFWPSGCFYTGFCLSTLAAITRRLPRRALLPGPRADDLRSWWSFKENAGQDSASAIGFVDLFLDREPNWNLPGRIDARAAMRLRGGQAARRGSNMAGG